MDLVYYWQGLTKRDVQRMFRDMPAMLQFFQMVAGISLPHRTYRQVLVDEPAAQEVSQHAILGKRFLRPLLTNPREDWLPAHELAHQWWGNWITCKDWSHMWLNEGLVTFLVAAYKQRRWGNHAYQRELSLARKRYANAKRRGFDVPLSYTGRYPSLRIKRAIVYSKGALFFATLRTHLGERRFWRALREYTRQYRGKIVTSHDLQRAFESSTKTSLTSLFQTWVYGTNNAPKKHSPIARPH
jgi:aminopeptidase N